MKKLLFAFSILLTTLSVFAQDSITSIQVVITTYPPHIDTIYLSGWKKIVEKDDSDIVVKYPDSSKHFYKLLPAPVTIENTKPQAQFGVMAAQLDVTQTESLMKSAGIKIVRVPYFFGQTLNNQKLIDQYLADGFFVLINFNYLNTSNTVPYPSDTAMIRKEAEKFFQHFKKYNDSGRIVYVANENEYDNGFVTNIASGYHSGNFSNYLNELKIVCDVGHKYGFKVTDAGITSTALQRWTYSQLIGDAQKQWATNYYVGLNNNYDSLVKFVDAYLFALKYGGINIDAINVHWYNNTTCSGGFTTATIAYMNAANESQLVCNEFGVKQATAWDCTVKEIKGNVICGIAYSGTATSPAITLSTTMLSELQ